MKKFFLILLANALPFFGQCAQGDLPTILPQFEKYAENAQARWKTPGMAIAIVKDNQIVYAKGFGIKEMGQPGTIDEHTLFQIGSITKSFTSALVAIANDEKKLKWEDPVINYYPQFVMHEPWVTANFQVEDTLAQRSGLPEHSLDLLPIVGADRKEIIHALRYIKPGTSFRSTYAYQNSLFLVAAEVLQAATGKSWEQLLQDNIFSPLKMTESSSDKKSFLESKNAAWLHERRPDGTVRPLKKPFELMDWLYTYGPAGSINSNVLDMSKWLIVQMNEGKYEDHQIISKENVARMHRPFIFSNNFEELTNFYCLGWVSATYSPYPVVWHTGGTSGFSSMIAFVPEEKIGIVILTNENDILLGPALAFQFMDMYFGKPDRDWNEKLLAKKQEEEKKVLQLIDRHVEHPYAPLPLSEYAGTYTNDIYGEAQISVEDDHLQMVLGKNKIRFELRHYDRDIFRLFAQGIDEDGATNVMFGLDGTGKPAVMTLDVFVKDGNGTFTRK